MEKYLRQYAEPEVTALEGMPETGQWSKALVIPACNEAPDFLRPPPPCAGRSLLILVINESASSEAKMSSGNQVLAASVRSRFEPLWQPAPGFSGFGLSLLRDPLTPRDVLLVDRFGEGRKLPAKGGVGHARKIGADLAASLIHRGRIDSPWIHCSDADVSLPKTYFGCSDAGQHVPPDSAALVYPFVHCAASDGKDSEEVIFATRLYEFSLRYYRAGMKYICSPYAFHTIGSTIAVNAMHYAKVRGFPRREAGEDFYLLNKLAKVGRVVELPAGEDCEPIEIRARRSNRVPFGTGAAVARIAALADPAADFLFYNPEVFVLLRHWLESWPEIWRSRLVAAGADPLSGCPELPGPGLCLLQGLKKIGTVYGLDHAFSHSRNLEQFLRHMHIWFDAFRTLKLIHALRDQCLPSVSLLGLASAGNFSRLLALDPDLKACYEKLY